MKRNGFTLVELIAVIVILSILILLSFGAYTGIQSTVIENQYNNIISRITNAAEEYAQENGVTEVIYLNVEELIKSGKLTPDDEEYIYDPRDNSIMNCLVIKVTNDDGEYTGIIDDIYENEDGTCDNTYIKENSMTIACNGEVCSDDWYQGQVALTIRGISDETLNQSTVIWTNYLGENFEQKPGEVKSYLVQTDSILTTTFHATIITPENNRYLLSKNIKIDNEVPILIKHSMSMDYGDYENETEYVNIQKLNIEASDVSGSGVAGYMLTPNTCSNNIDDYSNNTSLSILGRGNYNICIIDNVGNITSKSINIKAVTFNVNNQSIGRDIKVPVYYLEDNPNFPLLVPSRPGYDFNYWQTDSPEPKRIYNALDLNDGDTLVANWHFEDIKMPADKIDKDSVGVLIENKVNIILVLDYSGSMSNSDMSQVRSASREFAERMSFEVGSRLSIVMFESTAYIHLNQGTDRDQVLESIDDIPNGTGGTNFANALAKTVNLVEEMEDLENTYIIFMSDGAGNSGFDSYRQTLIDKGCTIYSIGIGSGASSSLLIKIASSAENYYSGSNFSEMFEIFSRIQDEIREQTTYKSLNGKIELPNLYVSEEFPFVLMLGEQQYIYNTIDEFSDLLTVVDGVYYLDLIKVDNKFLLNGDLSKINFTYYYDELDEG